MIASSASYGMYMSSVNYWNIYHNTYSMFGTSSYGIYNTTTTNEIKNNIFHLLLLPQAVMLFIALWQVHRVVLIIIFIGILWVQIFI